MANEEIVTNENMWKKKLEAYVHDPAEKALILLRIREGHEAGTVATLKDILQLPESMSSEVRNADHWAAAADRPSLPKGGQYRVNFVKKPELIHPLSAERIQVDEISDIDPRIMETLSTDHFERLIIKDDVDQPDYQLTFLSFWRFASLMPSASEIKSLWNVLPADTRIPDHSIWQHLDLTSALAGCAAVGDPGLMSVSLGPVQSFISNARSSSDLWAGSHLISYLTWKAIQVIADRYGPDSVILPSLRGLYLVDEWLLDKAKQAGKYDKWIELLDNSCASSDYDSLSDSHPYYRATIPNRFMAVVPYSAAEEIGSVIVQEVRKSLKELAMTAMKKIRRAIGGLQGNHYEEQIDIQLRDFPEVNWSVAKWPTSLDSNEDVSYISNALKVATGLEKPSVFGSSLWNLLNQDIDIDSSLHTDFQGVEFYKPNPGILYPAVVDLVEIVHGSAKLQRTFDQYEQKGFRCTLCGEREWLTDVKEVAIRGKNEDVRFLRIPDQNNTLEGKRSGGMWQEIAKKKPSWAKATERLCAICTVKRLWPNIRGPLNLKRSDSTGSHADDPYYGDAEPEDATDQSVQTESKVQNQRYVISTHTMALVPVISNAITTIKKDTTGQAVTNLKKGLKKIRQELGQSQFNSLEDKDLVSQGLQWSAFPKRLARDLGSLQDKELTKELHLFPAVLELYRNASDDELNNFYKTLKDIGLKEVSKHTYYAILKSDGDRMGKFLSGDNTGTDNDADKGMCYKEAFHQKICDMLESIAQGNPSLKSYLEAARLSSPGRHMSISSALSTFSSKAAPYLIEELLSGKVVYSGGDDLLAFLPVDDVLPALGMLKQFYQGVKLGDKFGRDLGDVQLGNGWAKFDGQLSLCMGSKATISAGLVIAHYSYPLLAVLRELDEAERIAKMSGRNAFCIRVLKRSGGEESVVASFDLPKYQGNTSDQAPVPLMQGLLDLLKNKVSRRAMFIAKSFLEQLPPPDLGDHERMESWRNMITSALAKQLSGDVDRVDRASDSDNDIWQLCNNLVTLALATRSDSSSVNDGQVQSANKYLSGLLGVVEFIARYQDDLPVEAPGKQGMEGVKIPR